MLYNLRNGRTIELTWEQFDKMTDEDEEYLVAFGHGEDVNSPWRGSMLERPDNKLDDDVPELTDISAEIKLSNPEFFDEDD